MKNLALTKQEIMALYKDKGYNTKQVASILGISRRTLYNLLEDRIPLDKRERYIKLIKRLKPLHNTMFIEVETNKEVVEALEYLHTCGCGFAIGSNGTDLEIQDLVDKSYKIIKKFISESKI